MSAKSLTITDSVSLTALISSASRNNSSMWSVMGARSSGSGTSFSSWMARRFSAALRRACGLPPPWRTHRVPPASGYFRQGWPCRFLAPQCRGPSRGSGVSSAFKGSTAVMILSLVGCRVCNAHGGVRVQDPRRVGGYWFAAGPQPHAGPPGELDGYLVVDLDGVG